MNFLSFSLVVIFFFFPNFFNTRIERPVIGVISQPTLCNPSLPVEHDDDHYSYINSDYVKWLQMSGERVIPILYDWSDFKRKYFFDRINGILFPGGNCPMTYGSDFLDSQKSFVEWSMNGTFFPIWGSCQGFESLFIIIAGNDSVLYRGFKSHGINLPLDFNEMYNSRMFQNVSSHIMNILKLLPVTYNSHYWGIEPHIFNSTPKLFNFFEVISTNFDVNNKQFISTVEAKKFPIYGAQWHSEMVIFADLPKEIEHSYDAVIANQVTSTFFVEECRKSDHRFDEENHISEDDYGIENYNPVFIGKEGGSSIRQAYFFKKQNGYVNPHHPNDNNPANVEDCKKENKKKTVETVVFVVISVLLTSLVCFCCCLFWGILCFLFRGKVKTRRNRSDSKNDSVNADDSEFKDFSLLKEGEEVEDS